MAAAERDARVRGLMGRHGEQGREGKNGERPGDQIDHAGPFCENRAMHGGIEHHESSKIFGIVQALIFIGVVATAVMYKRRQKLMEKDIGANPLAPDPRLSVRRTPVPGAPAGAGAEAPPPKSEAPPKVESAFPNWSKETPPHQILGVKPGASPAEIETAYKKLLKRYHPDRFSSWGAGYQTRAHHVILLIQDARDRLLSGK
jgi:hypothetical protein